MEFNPESHRLTLSDGWFTSPNNVNEFDVPRDRVGYLRLSQIQRFLREARGKLEKEVDHPVTVAINCAPVGGIRVHGGDDQMRYQFYQLDDDDRMFLTVSVDYARVETWEEFEDRVDDYFERRGVKFSEIRFCGPANSVEMDFTAPLDWTVSQCGAFSDALAMLLQNDRVNLSTPSGAYNLVSAGFPALVLGEAENEWLEVKQENYGIAADSQKYEFACDVASFANSDSGGLIVLGIASERDPSGNDVLARITPCRRGSINVQRYMQILRERVVPPVEGLRLDVIPIDLGDIMAVYIPPQPEEIKPFIVKGAMIDSKVRGSFFSIPHRRGSEKWAMSPEAVHSMLVAARTVLRGRKYAEPSEE
ncbi:ATP-binding protein [Streptomyces sp. NPDC005760]|uniref:AlbA family DNA-binding domain-containing protein n=1 Tax=Streptomyces sp. NPDC005760 TaxID=3156718 RepID=UPI0033D1D93F